jgi:hypothetical protein
MHKYLLTGFLVFALVLSTAGAAFAQDLPEPFCGDLSDDDCEIIANAQEAALELSSYTSSAEFDVSVSGIPDLPADELAFQWTQDVNFAVDPDLLANMADFMTMAPEEMMDNQEEMTDVVLDFYQGLSLDADFSLTMPEEIAALLSADSLVEIPEEIAVQVVIVDGFAYVNTEDLAVFEPSLTDMGEWIGIDLVGLMEMGFEQSMAAAQDAPQQQSMMAGFAAGAMFSNEEVRNLVEEFTIVERLDDESFDDEDAAVFSTTFDFGGFVASEGLWDFVEANLDLINQVSEEQITPEQLQEVRMGAAFVGPMLFQTLDFASTQTIGLDTYYPYASELTIDWDLSTIMGFVQAMQGGDTPSGGERPDAEFNLSLSTTNSNFNDAPEIAAPEDAYIVPLEAMEGME